MKLYEILFEEVNDLIEIVGYHWSNNPDLTIDTISTDPRETRQSGSRKRKYVGFYITMPKNSNLQSTEDLPSRMEANPEDGKNYGDYLYKVVLEVLRSNIFLDQNLLGSTRVSAEDLKGKFNNIQFIYVPKGIPTAEGIVLDKNTIKRFEKIEQ